MTDAATCRSTGASASWPPGPAGRPAPTRTRASPPDAGGGPGRSPGPPAGDADRPPQPPSSAARSRKSRKSWTWSVPGRSDSIAARLAEHVAQVGVARRLGPAEGLGGRRHDGVEPEVGPVVVEASGQVAGPDRPVERDSRDASGSVQRSLTLPRSRRRRIRRAGSGVQRGHGVAGPDRAGVDVRVAEVVVGDRPVLVADQPVRLDDVRVEATWTLASSATLWMVPTRSSLNSRRASPRSLT